MRGIWGFFLHGVSSVEANKVCLNERGSILKLSYCVLNDDVTHQLKLLLESWTTWEAN